MRENPEIPLPSPLHDGGPLPIKPPPATLILAIKSQGLTDREIAEALGVGTSTVNRIRNGKIAKVSSDLYFSLLGLCHSVIIRAINHEQEAAYAR